MPLLDAIERRTLRGRLALLAIYALLAAGGVAMVVPFLVMLGGSVRGAADTREKGLVPRYLHDDNALYARFAEALMNERLQSLNVAHGLHCREFSDLTKERRLLVGDSPTPAMGRRLSVGDSPTPAMGRRLSVGDSHASLWPAFVSEKLSSAPHWTYAVGFSSAPVTRTTPFVLRDFRDHLRKKYATLDALNRAVGGGLENWDSVVLNPESYLGRREPVNPDGLMAEWVLFKPTADPGLRVWMSVEGWFRAVFLAARYGTIAAYNARWGRDYADFSEIPVPSRAPETEELREDWEIFVREVVGLQWVSTECGGSPPLFPSHNVGGGLPPPAQTYEPPPQNGGKPPPQSGGEPPHSLSALELRSAPLESLRLLTLESMWRDWLREKGFDVPDNEPLPQRETHAAAFDARKNAWRAEFIIRNYRAVFGHILLHGRGVWNTVVYCFWAVLGALVVNPLAAYTLSRFPLRHGY
ncbi:MAG: beta-galactosidase, partial [Kiritimatiellaeota bacterium]|nr:beta-galactosidase [Kiritimatiellota bacterium]